MMFGKTPWTGNSEYELIRNIERTPLKFPYEVSKTTKDFISRCMAIDENNRFSWDELLRHEIFNGYFVKKQQQNKQFENKYKNIMNNIRQQVKTDEIDLESKFQELGVGKGSSLNAEKFETLMKSVDPILTKQEISYIFNKIASSGGNTVSYDEFQRALQKEGIPMSMIRKNSVDNQKQSDPFGPMGGGLFDLLVNQIVSPNDQGISPYMKGFSPQKQQINGVNQLALLQQQQQHISALNAMNMNQFGMGGMGRMNNMGMMNYGQMNGQMNGQMGGQMNGQMGGQMGGGFNYGGYGMRNGWM